MRRFARVVPLAALAALVLLGPARGAHALPPEERSWDLKLNLYGWLASFEAEVTAGDVTTDIEMSFFDLLGDLGWAVMGGAEGRYRRGLLLLDVIGMQLVVDESGSPRTVPFQALPGGPGGELTFGEFDVHTRVTTWAIDVKPGFRVLSMPTVKLLGREADAEDRRRFDVDLLAGFRYWNVNVKTGIETTGPSLTVGGAPVSPPGILPPIDTGDVEFPGTFLRGIDKAKQIEVDWFDPLVGLRLSADVTRRWTVFVMGDVGGWNVGEASDLTWQVLGGSRIALSDHWALEGGYRVLSVDRNSTFENVTMHGPQIGAVFRF